MKLFNKIDAFFLFDPDTGERGTISDYCWFYGALGFNLTVGTVFIHQLITF